MAAPTTKTTAPATTEALTAPATRGSNGALEQVPTYVPEGREGLETITKEDILIPRLVLAQALSPQVTDGDPNRIEGLQPGMLFNSITGEVYGNEVRVQILKKDALRAMEFYPMDDGGGVADPNVPLNDPRLKWGPDGEKPVATLFRDYIARLLPSGEMIALSFKSSGIKAAKTLNGLIVLRARPIYAGAYVISTGTELKPKPHKIFKVKNDGFPSQEDIEVGREMFLALKDLDTTTTIHRDENTVDDTDFPHGANVDESVADRHPDM